MAIDREVRRRFVAGKKGAAALRPYGFIVVFEWLTVLQIDGGL